MSKSTTIDARLTVQNANTEAEKLLEAFKTEVEMNLNLSSNLPLIKRIKADHFSWPDKEIKPIKRVVSDIASVSTFDSEAGLSERTALFAEAMKESLLDERGKEGISQKIANGDKKIKSILNKILRFEELCVKMGYLVRKKQIEILRKNSKKILGKVLEKFDMFKRQHADSIALCILYNIAAEIGLTKNKFLEISAEISSKKVLKIMIIKKSKCYSMVKLLLRRG